MEGGKGKWIEGEIDIWMSGRGKNMNKGDGYIDINEGGGVNKCMREDYRR